MRYSVSFTRSAGAVKIKPVFLLTNQRGEVVETSWMQGQQSMAQAAAWNKANDAMKCPEQWCAAAVMQVPAA